MFPLRSLLFPLFVASSVVVHGGFVFGFNFWDSAPRYRPPKRGRSSIAVRLSVASVASIAQKKEQVEQKPVPKKTPPPIPKLDIPTYTDVKRMIPPWVTDMPSTWAAAVPKPVETKAPPPEKIEEPIEEPVIEEVKEVVEEPPPEKMEEPPPEKVEESVEVAKEESVASAASTASAASQADNGAIVEVVEDFPENLPSNKAPHHPHEAWVEGKPLLGTVELRVTVGMRGTVEAISIHRSSGHQILDQAALEAVSSWRFVPGRRLGHPIVKDILVPITFDLKSL